ncbi:transcriptional regulator [Aerococcaceae bacterium NML191292]|nr:transcriptional regulator [Aerococcaceae bacterium NML210727]MCW6655375.1 transcriptional regulator [Aerococcaceae bacterium NML201296]MCW6660491.1 transcriptional regulator [Aerococcaceae bacterium NML191292]MCW6660608.1 transcriptional regulator [Aerococcaceae bacterium NML201209]
MLKSLNKIAGYRAMLSLDQYEMANKLGITPQAYSKKERGLTAFNDEEKKTIKEMLLPHFPNITIDEIFF